MLADMIRDYTIRRVLNSTDLLRLMSERDRMGRKMTACVFHPYDITIGPGEQVNHIRASRFDTNTLSIFVAELPYQVISSQQIRIMAGHENPFFIDYRDMWKQAIESVFNRAFYEALYSRKKPIPYPG
jgi:hypothetical protein